MSKIVKGDVEIQGSDFLINGNRVVSSVNNETADSNGNISIEVDTIDLVGIDGKSVFFYEDRFIVDKTTKSARIIDSDAELATEKTRIETFETIFNTWKRFSHSYTNYPTFPSDPSELNTWSYNSSTDLIRNSTNSSTYIGFVSPEVYDNYEFEVNLSSTDTDDDFIGIVLAYTEIDGLQYTLSATRRMKPQSWVGGGLDRMNWIWVVSYNFMQGTSAGEYLVADGTSSVTSFNTGWSTYPNGVNVKAKRNANIITVSTTQFNNINTYVGELTVDLNSNPLLYKFKNPCSIGYSAHSQPNSTFKTIKFTGDQNTIYDVRDGGVWYYQNDAWVLSDTDSMYTNLTYGNIYSNPNTNKMFFIDSTSTSYTIAGLSVGTDIGQVPNMISYDYLNSASGYQKLPNGLTLQWLTVTGTGTSVTATLPITFQNAILSGYCTEQTLSANTTSIYTVNLNSSTTSTVVVSANFLSAGSVSTSGTFNTKVLVIGY